MYTSMHTVYSLKAQNVHGEGKDFHDRDKHLKTLSVAELRFARGCAALIRCTRPSLPFSPVQRSGTTPRFSPFVRKSQPLRFYAAG